MKKYERKTDKNAVWQGRVTKQFKKWKASRPKSVKKKEPEVKQEIPVIKKTSWW
jgi:hypothetical protein